MIKIRGKLDDLTGKKFGRLTVIERDNSKGTKNGAYWICECECGNKKSIQAGALKSGATQSCGCLNKEINSKQKEISGMIGKKFGKLTIIERAESRTTPSGQKKAMWKCKCDCGNITTVTFQDLKTGHTKSCGCMPTVTKGHNLIDLTGKRFGKLTVIKRSKDYIYKSKRGFTTTPQWLCKCDCGNVAIVQGGNLRSGNTIHCGCEQISSKGEIKVSSFLTDNNIKFLSQYTFDDLRNENGNLLKFDFAILNSIYNVVMLVEYQGEQHYKDCGEFGRYQREYSDKVKRDYCKENNIPLFEIRYDDDLEYVLNKLLNEIHTYLD